MTPTYVLYSFKLKWLNKEEWRKEKMNNKINIKYVLSAQVFDFIKKVFIRYNKVYNHEELLHVKLLNSKNYTKYKYINI